MRRLLILLVSFSIFLIGCKDNQHMTELTIEEMNQLWDETAGTKDNLWFNSPNLGFSNFNVDYDNQEVIYTWTVTFHEKFYQKLIVDNPKYFYKLQFPEDVSSILGVEETEYYQFQQFEPNGKRKYSIFIKIEVLNILSEEVIEGLRNNLDYKLMIYDASLNPVSLWSISKIAQDMTTLYK